MPRNVRTGRMEVELSVNVPDTLGPAGLNATRVNDAFGTVAGAVKFKESVSQSSVGDTANVCAKTPPESVTFRNIGDVAISTTASV